MAAVLAFAVDAGHLSLDPERRPAGAAVQAADRLVERAVAVVVLAALNVALTGGYAGESGKRDAVRRRREADVGLALINNGCVKAHARDPRAKRVTTMPELMKLLKDIWSLRLCGNRSAS